MIGWRGWRLRAAAVAIFVGLPSFAPAADLLQAILARAANAPLAAVGDVVSQESRWENGGIWTYSEVSVRRSLGASVPSTILVRERGGVVGRIGQQVSHSRLIDPSRPHLLLLWRDPETGLWTPGIGGVLPVVLVGGEEWVGELSLDAVLGALQAVVQ
jgi:hypothetical protein